MWSQLLRDMSGRAHNYIPSVVGEKTAFSVQLLVAFYYIYNPLYLQICFRAGTSISPVLSLSLSLYLSLYFSLFFNLLQSAK